MVDTVEFGEWEEVGWDDVKNVQLPVELVRAGRKEGEICGEFATFRCVGPRLGLHPSLFAGWVPIKVVRLMVSGFPWCDVDWSPGTFREMIGEWTTCLRKLHLWSASGSCSVGRRLGGGER